jgi:hypothetical protein
MVVLPKHTYGLVSIEFCPAILHVMFLRDLRLTHIHTYTHTYTHTHTHTKDQERRQIDEN